MKTNTRTRTRKRCILCGRSEGVFVTTSRTTARWMEMPTRTKVAHHHEACLRVADEHAQAARERQSTLYRQAIQARRAGATQEEWEAIEDLADGITTGYSGPWPEP